VRYEDAALVLREAYQAGRFDAAWRIVVPLLEDANPKGGQFKKGGGREPGGTQAAKDKAKKSKQSKAAAAKKTMSSDKPPAGRTPPGGSGGGGLGEGGGTGHADDGHHQRIKEVHESIDRSLQASDLPAPVQAEFGQTAKSVVGKMTPEAVRRFHANLKGFQWYPTHGALTEAYKAKYPGVSIKGVLKGAFDPDGVIHLDGGGELFGRPATLSEFYAHEMTHDIDGTDHEISRSAAWIRVWEAEKGFLNKNGQSKSSEGFAEFGEMLLGGIVTRKQMREVMPKSLKVWEAHGL
jgi:hypothetical protein